MFVRTIRTKTTRNLLEALREAGDTLAYLGLEVRSIQEVKQLVSGKTGDILAYEVTSEVDDAAEWALTNHVRRVNKVRVDAAAEVFEAYVTKEVK